MSVRITQLSDFPLICFLVLVSEDHYFKAMCSLSANQFWNKTALRGEKRETEKDRQSERERRNSNNNKIEERKKGEKKKEEKNEWEKHSTLRN